MSPSAQSPTGDDRESRPELAVALVHVPKSQLTSATSQSPGNATLARDYGRIRGLAGAVAGRESGGSGGTFGWTSSRRI
jgi:hypothetical protein